MRGDRPTTGSELAAVFAAESKFPFCVIYSLRTYMHMCMHMYSYPQERLDLAAARVTLALQRV